MIQGSRCVLLKESGDKMKLINIGFGNMVSPNRLVAIVSPESAPIKRIIQDARDRGSLIDATYGRRTRAVIITDSDHVILSAVQPETAADSQPVQNSVTKPATLPQTGQNWWPVWILSILGLVSLTAGITLRRR